jgi:hypothetical protein
MPTPEEFDAIEKRIHGGLASVEKENAYQRSFDPIDENLHIEVSQGSTFNIEKIEGQDSQFGDHTINGVTDADKRRTRCINYRYIAEGLRRKLRAFL